MSVSTVVFVLLDAFRWDYVDPVDTPFLHGLAEAGVYVQKLKSSNGFGQRSTVFCGTHPDRTGNYTMFTLDPAQSPFRFLARNVPLLGLAQRFIDTGWRGSGRVGAAIRRRFVDLPARRLASYVPSAFIPLDVLHLIGIGEDERPIHEPGSLPVESLFDVLHRREREYAYLMYPAVSCQDDRTFELVLHDLRRPRPLHLIQFSDADLFGHLAGPESMTRHRAAGELDRKLRALKRAFDAACEEVAWLIIGDHGMMQVCETVDVSAIVHGAATRRGWRHGKDYLLFLDSTLARLWALSSRAEKGLADLFDDPALGRTGVQVTDTLAAECRIPWRDRRHGDCIWWAHPGVLIHPDYFHPALQVVKGMHGYDSRHEKMQGFAIAWRNGIQPKVLVQRSLVDICPTLCELLGVPPPQLSEGESLVAISPAGPTVPGTH